MATKKSFRERLEDQRKELKKRGRKSEILFLKDGDVVRVRILNAGEDKEFIFEVTTFYLGGDIKNVYSPATFGLPCAFMEKYEELKASKVAADKKLAKKLSPRKKSFTLGVIYKDTKGKEIDDEATGEGGKLIQLGSASQAAEIIDYFLDVEDWGDFFDEDGGYDFKLKRVGAGKLDTEYSVSPCPKSKVARKWRGIFDLEERIKGIIPTYEETQELLEQWLSTGVDDDEEEEEAPRKRKPKSNRDV
jgi:hypothetical protein